MSELKYILDTINKDFEDNKNIPKYNILGDVIKAYRIFTLKDMTKNNIDILKMMIIDESRLHYNRIVNVKYRKIGNIYELKVSYNFNP